MVSDLLRNQVLLSSASAWLIAQIAKTIVAFVQGKGLQPKYLFRSGGMPSAHSAFVSALTTAIAMDAGTGSVAFAVSAALALIVMYDATDVRHSVGRQSIIINRIVEEIRLGRPMTELKSDLREFVGHTPFQVFAGAAMGIAIAWAWLTISG